MTQKKRTEMKKTIRAESENCPFGESEQKSAENQYRQNQADSSNDTEKEDVFERSVMKSKE